MRTRTTTMCVAVAVLLLALPCAYARQAEVCETILPNGLKVLTKEVRTAPVVSIAVWYKVGSRNEQLGKTGMSHLLEHMQFKGTKKFKKGEIDSLIRRNGGLGNAATWKDFTYYWTTIASEKLELVLQIEADRMVNSLLDPKEFEAEKTVVLSELEGDENNPEYLMFYELYATAFKGHPYQWPTIGWKKDVESITRDELYEYYRTFYQPNNATVVMVGDFETEKALALVRKHFGRIPRGSTPPEVTAVEPKQLGERRAVVQRAGVAERLMAGYHIPEISHRDIYALDVLEIILATGNSSRLYKRLVDSRLATEVWAGGALSKDPDLFIIGATARDGVSIGDVEEALNAEIERLKDEPITDEELQKALNQLEASFVYENDSVTAQARRLGEYETKRSWKLLDEYLPNARKVTNADVQRVAQKYLTQRNRTVVTFIPDEEREPTTVKTTKNGPTVLEDSVTSETEKVSDQKPLASGMITASPASTNSHNTSTSRSTPHRVTLENGVVVIVYENRSNATVAVEGSVWAGSILDPEGKSGVAEMTAKLLTKGTSRHTADDFAHELDFNAMSLETSAHTEYVRLSGYSLSKRFVRLLDLVAEALSNPTFPEDEFQKLKELRLSAIKQERDNPNSIADRAFSGMVFAKGHPYHRLSVEEELDNTLAINREDIIEFYKSHYGHSGLILVVVGDVDAESAVEAVKARFGDWKAGGATSPVIPDTPLQKGISKRVIPMPGKSQAVVMLGYAGGLKRSDPDFYAAMVMNHVLGGGGALGSRLGNVIRDDMGLVYEIWSTLGASLGAGAFYAYLGTNPRAVDKAVSTLLHQMELMRNQGATAGEVRDAIDFIAGSFPARRLERNNTIAETLHAAEIYGLGMDYIQRYQSLYRAVTPEQVNEAAKKYLHPDRYTLVIAGPYESD